MSTPNGNFDAFYSKGGWVYSPEAERTFLNKMIIDPLGLKKGSRLLEIGCGMGLQSHLFQESGFDVLGIDVSAVGINHAKLHFPGTQFLCMAAEELPEKFGEKSFDIIYVRGMNWYVYELDGTNRWGVDVPGQTKELFTLLKKNGLFILQVATDFSGKRPDNAIHYNELKDYLRLFSRFGEITRLSDWSGRILRSEEDAKRCKCNLILAVKKPGAINLGQILSTAGRSFVLSFFRRKKQAP